jgi:hypothetical protein
VPLDEGNRGGMGGALLPLHPGAGGRRLVTRRMAESWGAAARLVPRRKTVSGWVVAGPRGLGPKADWASLMWGENMKKLEWTGWTESSRWVIIVDYYNGFFSRNWI